MTTRVTPLRLTALIALAAMWTLAASASACDYSKNKTASAEHSCCASKAATTACAQPSAKTAATVAVVAPVAVAPAAPAGYRALPGITQPAPVVAGLMAFLDPETGQLTGPISGFVVPDDVARMFQAPADLTPVTMPNGSVMLDLQGTLQDYYVLSIDPMGRRTIRCVQNARQAQAPAAPVILPISDR